MSNLTALEQYQRVTANYWAFTLTDGALRMLVVFHFHQLGYTSFEIAFFFFYEFFGILTNLYGGWLGARFGLRLTLWLGTWLQIGALLMLIPVADSWPKWWSVAYVMAAQALSGIAKDLNKMSAKSVIKTVVKSNDGDQQLFRWVAILTGSKNALKGVGFFLGGVLLTALGFNASVGVMAADNPGVPRHPGTARGHGTDETQVPFHSRSPNAKASTSSPWRGCSSLAPGMSGSWSPCRSSSKRPWDGASGKWAVSWGSG